MNRTFIILQMKIYILVWKKNQYKYIVNYEYALYIHTCVINYIIGLFITTYTN